MNSFGWSYLNPLLPISSLFYGKLSWSSWWVLRCQTSPQDAKPPQCIDTIYSTTVYHLFIYFIYSEYITHWKKIFGSLKVIIILDHNNESNLRKLNLQSSAICLSVQVLSGHLVFIRRITIIHNKTTPWTRLRVAFSDKTVLILYRPWSFPRSRRGA